MDFLVSLDDKPRSQNIEESPTRAISGGPTRNPWVEGLRVLAAVGIVWFHSGARGHEFAYTGLSFFLIASFYFEGRKSVPATLSLRLGVERYLVPWAFWFLFYGTTRLAAKMPFFPTSYGAVSPLSKILSGTSIHLWYLPFVFVLTVAIRFAINCLSTKTVFLLAAVALFILIPTISLEWSPSYEIYKPVAQYTQALPAVLFGILLGTSRDGPLSGGIIFASLISLMIAGWTCSLPFGFQDALAAILMIGALAAGDNLRLPVAFPFVRGLPRLTYGVYLIHPLFLSLSKKLCSSEAADAILASAASFGATWALRRYTGRFGRAIT